MDIDPSETSYGYIPTQSTCFVFVVLFGISTALHLGQGVWYRMWWILPTIVLAGALECLGWAGRLWSSYSPLNDSAFMIQIVSIILGPTPLLAANFIILGALIRLLGPVYSRLGPRVYSIVFLSCDIISLIVQGAGGGIAASAEDGDVDGTKLGGNIMLAGISFQLAVIVIYSIVSGEFLWRYFTDRPLRAKATNGSQATLSGIYRGDLTMKLKVMLGALAFDLLVLFIRSVYRVIELQDGWNGRIITTEVYFNVLDGAMIILAMYTFNFAHPGLLLGRSMGKTDAVPSNDSDVEMRTT
ncbi:RTA1 like protein [Cylindrobasidium torrendii FP15055 ss-10]|uniref:RTA1 like protein n=1 Tax=Cylindrobasidium torrendii FP15055 ss-10 TaxID=1314674 RepID=A0A0D7BFQ8_9AGAR|nr:RTA1 like protein [Cylindrobasidium torrendii FP15055 ss-10]